MRKLFKIIDFSLIPKKIEMILLLPAEYSVSNTPDKNEPTTDERIQALPETQSRGNEAQDTSGENEGRDGGAGEEDSRDL